MNAIHTSRAASRLSIAILSISLAGCPKDRPEERRGPPPPPTPSASSSSKACAGGGATFQDPTIGLMFPRQAGGYCTDPNGELRSFGEGAKKPLEAVCTEAFDGECEVYKGFGLRSVTTFRYVDGGGTAGSVDVVLSRFATAEGAYGMFTKRVVGETDPIDLKAPRDMHLATPAALGTGSAYLWKGALVVELTYTNEAESPAKLAESSDKLLAAIAAEVATRLPGSAALPASAAALPTQHRPSLGILFEPKDGFEVSGAGAGAYGYYTEDLQSSKRYRVISITRADAEQAKDVTQSLMKRKGATKEAGIGEAAVRLMTGEKDSARAEWIVARFGRQVLGVGDEPLVLKAEMSSAERDKFTLSRDQKIALLKTLLRPNK
jgi:hypothetical protein